MEIILLSVLAILIVILVILVYIRKKNEREFGNFSKDFWG